ncbi:unnamed protein product [Closterium sp. NIES-54]
MTMTSGSRRPHARSPSPEPARHPIEAFSYNNPFSTRHGFTDDNEQDWNLPVPLLESPPHVPDTRAAPIDWIVREQFLKVYTPHIVTLRLALLACNDNRRYSTWYLYSCYGQHMVGSERYISNAVSTPAVTYVSVANNTRLRASAQGIVLLKARGIRTHITLNGMPIVQNLIAAQLMDCGVNLSTEPKTRDILLHYTMPNKSRKQFGRARSKNGIYILDFSILHCSVLRSRAAHLPRADGEKRRAPPMKGGGGAILVDGEPQLAAKMADGAPHMAARQASGALPAKAGGLLARTKGGKKRKSRRNLQTPQRRTRISGFRADDAIWYQRLGHPSRVTLKNCIEVGVFALGALLRPDGTKVRGATHLRNCTVCPEAALSHQPFPLLEPGTNRYAKLEKVYSDFLNVGHCGMNDKMCMLTFVDARTRYVWIMIMEARSRAYEVFRLWLAHAQRQSGEKLKIWQSDGAADFRSKEMQDYLAKKGIEHHVSLPYAHQQQGVAERTKRTLMTKVWALMKQSKLPPTYWTYAMHHAVRVHNLLSTTAITGNSSPHVKWTRTKGNTSMIRVWGCMVQYRPPMSTIGKFTSRARWGIHLGISHEHKAWLILDLMSQKIKNARGIIFYEWLFLRQFREDEQANANPGGGHSYASPEDEAAAAILGQDAQRRVHKSRHTSVRILLAIVAARHLPLRQIDVKNAFLYALVDGAKALAVVPAQHPSRDRLQAAASRSQHVSLRFPRQIHSTHGHDLLYTGSSNELLEQFEKSLAGRVDIICYHDVKQFLGINISYSPEAIHLSATKYAEELGKRFNIASAPLSTPYRTPGPNHKLDNKALSLAGLHTYQQQLGCLIFASVTCRPDLRLPHEATVTSAAYACPARKLPALPTRCCYCPRAAFLARALPDLPARCLHRWRPARALHALLAHCPHAAGVACALPLGRALPALCPHSPRAALSALPALPCALSALQLLLLPAPHCPAVPEPHRTAQATPPCRGASPCRAAPRCLVAWQICFYCCTAASATATATAATATAAINDGYTQFADLFTHLRSSDARYRAALKPEFLAANPPPMYITLYYLVTRLPDSLRAVRDHFLALDPTEITLALLEKHLLEAEKSSVAVAASRGTPRSPFFEGCSPSLLAPSIATTAAVDFLRTEEIGAASAPRKRRRNSKG